MCSTVSRRGERGVMCATVIRGEEGEGVMCATVITREGGGKGSCAQQVTERNRALERVSWVQ